MSCKIIHKVNYEKWEGRKYENMPQYLPVTSSCWQSSSWWTPTCFGCRVVYTAGVDLGSRMNYQRYSYQRSRGMRGFHTRSYRRMFASCARRILRRNRLVWSLLSRPETEKREKWREALTQGQFHISPYPVVSSYLAPETTLISHIHRLTPTIHPTPKRPNDVICSRDPLTPVP